MKKATKNAYTKGLNRDLDKHIPQNEFLYNNENFRLITQEGQSSILLENVKGNSPIYDNSETTQMQVPEGQEIIGHYVFDNKDIVLFSTTTDSGTDDYPTESYIYLYKYDVDSKEYYPRITLYEDTSNDIVGTGLRLKDDISCIGRKETNYVRKVYWTDNDNPLRHINIAPDTDDTTGLPKSGTSESDYTDLASQPAWKFDMVGKLDNSSITFNGYGEGNLLVGKVQYALRYFNKYGNSSNYYIDPQLIPIPNKVGNTSLDLEGAEVNTNSNKSINITINVSNNNDYDYVEVLGIYHYNNTGTPSVKVIQHTDLDDDTNTIKVTDFGVNYINETSIEDLQTIKTDYIAKTLDRKDDRLFIGGLTESYFDVDYDARAYRFADDGTGYIRATVYESDLSTYLNVTSSNWDSVPEEHDVINKYKNRLSYDSHVSSHPDFDFKYRADGVTLGGEGPNVSYSFTTDYNYIIDNGDITDDGTFVTSNVTNKSHLGIIRGFQRDEIYRFGIVFIDNKGRRSFVKWVGDIRMPTIEEYDIIYRSGDDVYARPIVINFDITNIPTNDDGSFMDWQIVYVPRTSYNRTVLSTGYISTLFNPDDPDGSSPKTHIFKNYLKSSCEVDTPESYKLVEYISSDLDFNNINLESTYIKLNNKVLNIDSTYSVLRDETDISLGYSIYPLLKIDKYLTSDLTLDSTLNPILKTLRLDTQSDFKPGVGAIAYELGSDYAMYVPKSYYVSSSLQVSPIAEFPTINFRVYNDRYFYATTRPACDDLYNITNMITPTVLYFDDNIDNDISENVGYAYIKRQIAPYNGDSYLDRINDNYIACSEVSSFSNESAVYGDTYIGYYDRTRSVITRTFASRKIGGSKSFEWGSILSTNTLTSPVAVTSTDKYIQSSGASHSVYLPLETSVVLPLQHGFQIHKHHKEDNVRLVTDKDNRYEITEQVFLKEDNEGGFMTELVDYPDMFLYNPVYSKLNDVITHVQRPQFFEKYITFDTRIRYSDIKFNGALEDSWLTFRPNNLQDADTKYGGIEQIINWKNYLFCFQHRGFCMLPVNERAATSSNTGTPVVLGQGNILPKFLNYSQGSEKYGLQNGNKVLATENGIYWLDVIEEKFLRFSGRAKELNFITGMSSWFRDNLYETTEYNMGYDNQFKEVLISFSNISSKTLVFNELINRFQGFYTFRPSDYIMNPSLLSIRNDRLLYEHNIGSRGQWFNSVDNSIFEIIINDQTGLTKEFNNIVYASESFTESGGVDQPLDTLSYIQAYNDHLSSANINLKPYTPGDTLYTGGLSIPGTAPDTIKNIRRRQRLWRTTIPRVDSGNPDIDNYRMRDVYVRLKLTYDNSEGNQFILHPIVTYYTLSNLE